MEYLECPRSLCAEVKDFEEIKKLMTSVINKREKQRREEDSRRVARRRLEEELAGKERSPSPEPEKIPEDVESDVPIVPEPNTAEDVLAATPNPDLSALMHDCLPLHKEEFSAFAAAPDALLQQLILTGQLLSLCEHIRDQGVTVKALVLIFESMRGDMAAMCKDQLVEYYVSAGAPAWIPTLDDLVRVMYALGYPQPSASSSKTKQRLSATEAGAGPNSEGGGASGAGAVVRVHQVAAVLELLAVLCDKWTKGVLPLAMDTVAAKKLLVIVAHLHIDPRVASSCAISGLRSALLVLPELFSETEWSRALTDLAASVGGLGETYRSGAHVLHSLRGCTPRLAMLQQHAALQLIRRVDPKFSVRSGKRGNLALELLQELGGEGRAYDLVKRFTVEVKEKRGPKQMVKCWELLTVVEACDLIVWNYVFRGLSEDGDEARRAVSEHWNAYLCALEPNVKISGDSSVHRLRNDMTSWKNFYEFTVFPSQQQ